MQYENIGRDLASDLTYGSPFLGFIPHPVPAIANSTQTIPEINANHTCLPPVAGQKPEFPAFTVTRREDLATENVTTTDPQFPELWSEVLHGKMGFYIEGCISYRTFGKPHKTAWCYLLQVFSGGMKFGVCPNPGTIYAD